MASILKLINTSQSKTLIPKINKIFLNEFAETFVAKKNSHSVSKVDYEIYIHHTYYTQLHTGNR